jgi:hypothetical protein
MYVALQNPVHLHKKVGMEDFFGEKVANVE